MSNTIPTPGTVADTLTRMRGVWHDHVEVYDLAGNPLSEDALSGTPGPAPFDNLVYVDFDGFIYRQTNVTFRGRPITPGPSPDGWSRACWSLTNSARRHPSISG